MKTFGVVVLLAAAAGLPGCMVVPLAEPLPVYAAPAARTVVVHPHRPHHRHYPRYYYGR
jgi:hypothetical protein